MTTISVSQLKTNPSAVITQAADYPVAIENRNTVTAYMIGKTLFEKILKFLENQEDVRAAKTANFSKGRAFEDVAGELGI